jgi:DNA-binding NarL/FixJ family response regulator
LIAQQAMFALFEGDVARTLALSDPLLERPDDPAYCRGALPAAMIRVLAGRLDEAVAIANHAFEVRVGLGDQMHLADPGVYFVALILAWEQAGNLEQAITTARAAYGVAAAEQLRNGMAWLCVALSRAELASGRVRTAERLAREAAVLFGELEHPGARWGYGLVALSAGQAGAADTADEAIADLDAEPDTPLQLMDTEIDRARAWAVAAPGDLPRARAGLLAAADRAHAHELYALEAAALHDLTRLGAAAADRLVALADRVDGPLMAARVRCAIAHRDADTAELEQAAREFDALGASLDAAETWNEAAIVHRRDGNARAAAACALQAKTAAGACEGARTPSLAHGTDAAVLTRREREVATLASHGLASREIAEALVVSARTVENHLQRAYEKLGVTGRAELTDALARAGY